MKIISDILEILMKRFLLSNGANEMNKKVEVIDTIDILFSNYIDSDPKKFYEIMLDSARQDRDAEYTFKLTGGKNIEEELMDLSILATERARKIEEYGSGDDRWRSLSFILRKVAQTIFNEYESTSEHKGFLRLVK